MPPTRRKPPSNRKDRVAKRVSAARQEATGFTTKSESRGEENEEDSDGSSSSSSSSEESEEEHVDDLIELENFKDKCWSELTSSSLEDDIANLTGGKSSNGSSTTTENIIVGFRVRPQRSSDHDDTAVTSRGQEVMISHPSSNGAKDKHTFAFDYSFGGKSTQFDVFRDLGWPCLRNAWKGFNVSIFAYGQTGSGKSYSMMGTVKNPGLIRNVGNYLFDFIDRSYTDALNNGFDMKSRVTISCLEIYNEQIRDILAPFVEKNEPTLKRKGSLRSLQSEKSGKTSLRGGVFSKGAKAIGVKSAVERATNLKIRESAGRGVYVEGLCSVEVNSGREMSEFIDGATGNRETRATKMNDESSRSHLIFMIELENNASGNSVGKSKGRSSTFGKNISKKAKLNMIDLAGSERSKATGATGESLKEGANINKSLSTLGRVISSLSDPKASQLAPFRDSKLTHILKDALAGNARSSMLATAHPSAIYYEETLSTLRYASSVKKIKTNATMNAEAAAEDIISELRAEVVKLSTQLLSYQSANPAPLLRRGSKEQARRRPPPKRSSIARKVQQLGGVGPEESNGEVDDGEDDDDDEGGEEGGGEEGEEEGSLGNTTGKTSKKGGNWLSRSMGLGGSLSYNRGSSVAHNEQENDEERDQELAAILMERDELDLQLGLRNKERVGLELQLKAKAKELGKLESSLESHEAEVDDLAFALEASNTENRLLHDEIARLKRQSRTSSSSISDQVRDPQAFVKEQVMSALSSYQQVRKRNDTKKEEHGKLRRHILQSQKDPSAVVASLATNMGFWLLGQANQEGEEGGGGLSETLAMIAEANLKAMQAGEEMVDSDVMKTMLHSSVKDHSMEQLEELRAQLAESDREKEKMVAQLQLTSSHVDDLQSNVKDFSRVRVELEEQLAAQQSLLDSTMQVMKDRNLQDIDSWLKSAELLKMENSHEAQTIARLRVTVAEEVSLLQRLELLSSEIEKSPNTAPANKLDELNHVLAVAASRAITADMNPVVHRASNARKTIQAREDAISTLHLAMKSNDIELLRRALNDALSDSVCLDKSHPVVMDAIDTVNHLAQVSELESRLSTAASNQDQSLLLEAIASAEALGLTPEESGPMQSACLTLQRLEMDMQAKKELAKALESGSVDALQSALENATKAGIDSETREAASEAARLVAQQTSIASALRGAIASRSIELLQEACSKATMMLAHPTPPLSPASQVSTPTSAFSYESSLRDSFLKTDETICAGRSTLEGLLVDANELLNGLLLTAGAEAELEKAIQSRSLKELQDAILKAEEVGVGREEPSGLLHTGRILCTRMEAEAEATNKLVAAVHLGSDVGLLREALNEASLMGLRGPEIAAAQAVILELSMVQKLRVAAAEKDGGRLSTVISEARDLLTSADLSQSQHESTTSKYVADFLDSGRLLGPGGELEALRNIAPPKEGQHLSASAKHHYALTSVAMQVFKQDRRPSGGSLDNDARERRRSLVTLQKELELCENQLSLTSSAALEKRDSEAKLAAAMLDPHLVEQQFDNLTSSLAETAALLEELMGMKVVLESLEQRLPKDLIQAFSTGAFVTSCNERYDELATGGHDEGLTPDELFPVILEMTQNAPWEITWEQCVKFADIFDADGNGVIDRNEFVGFSKFMIIGSLLESMAEIGDSLRNRTDSQGGEVVLTLSGLSPDELIERVRKNTHVVEELLPLLPEDIYNYLSGPDFVSACQTKFDETDVDGSGDLDPSELVPIILEISKMHHGDVDPERAVEFCKVFDDDGNGVLDRDEFVSLHRFVVMMITLEAATTNDVRRHPAAVERFEEEERLAITHSNTSANASAIVPSSTSPSNSLPNHKLLSEGDGPARSASKGRKLSVLFSDIPSQPTKPMSLSQRMGGRGGSNSSQFKVPEADAHSNRSTSSESKSKAVSSQRPTLKKSDSLKQREAAERQAQNLRREMAETSSRIEQIDAEVETLLTKVDTSEEKIGEQIYRRKSWKESTEEGSISKVPSLPTPATTSPTPATNTNMGGLFGGGTVPTRVSGNSSRPEPVRRRSASLLAQKYLKHGGGEQHGAQSSQSKQTLVNGASARPTGRTSIAAQISAKTSERAAQRRQKSPARHFFPQVDSEPISSESKSPKVVPRVEDGVSPNGNRSVGRRSQSEARTTHMNSSSATSQASDQVPSPTVIVDTTSRPTIRRAPTASLRSPRSSLSKPSARPTRAPSPGIRRPSSSSSSGRRSASEERVSRGSHRSSTQRSRSSSSTPRSSTHSNNGETHGSMISYEGGRPSPVNRPSNGSVGGSSSRGRSVGRTADSSRLGSSQRESSRDRPSRSLSSTPSMTSRTGGVASQPTGVASVGVDRNVAHKVSQYESLSSPSTSSNSSRVNKARTTLSAKLNSAPSYPNGANQHKSSIGGLGRNIV